MHGKVAVPAAGILREAAVSRRRVLQFPPRRSLAWLLMKLFAARRARTARAVARAMRQGLAVID
jgi:hypothetical protein